MQQWRWWQMSCMFAWTLEGPVQAGGRGMLLALSLLKNKKHKNLNTAVCIQNQWTMLHTSAILQCFRNFWVWLWIRLAVGGFKVVIVLEKWEECKIHLLPSCAIYCSAFPSCMDSPGKEEAWTGLGERHQISSHSSCQSECLGSRHSVAPANPTGKRKQGQLCLPSFKQNYIINTIMEYPQ